jgi:hypothetical protein
MDWSILAPYGIPASIAVVAMVVAVVVTAIVVTRPRTTKRSAPRGPAPSSAVDPFYLDSSHAGEPRTQDGSGR